MQEYGQNTENAEGNRQTESIKKENGKRRKISFKYKCNVIAYSILFTVFFLVMVFHLHIFDDYRPAEIVKINGITDKSIAFYTGNLKITFYADGEEFTVNYEEPVKTTQRVKLHVGDTMHYLADNPNVFQFERTKHIILFSCVEGGIVALLIGITIYEIKKGFKD